jgi:hypothetical protein
MNGLLRHIAVIILTMVSLQALAVEEPHDTVYFYNSWEQMFCQEPVGMLVDPFIEAHSPFQIYFLIDDEKMNYVIESKHMFAALGDSIIFINSKYLKECFDGDVNLLYGYIPLMFNDKVAYFRFGGHPYGDSNYEYGLRTRWSDERTLNQISWYYYYIDFLRHKVLKVNHTVLSDLLKDYHDLLMRYEGMKDYKKHEVIEDYFLRYIDRATSDVMQPYILDLVDDSEWNTN